jgi:hypothetical protein
MHANAAPSLISICSQPTTASNAVGRGEFETAVSNSFSSALATEYFNVILTNRINCVTFASVPSRRSDRRLSV